MIVRTAASVTIDRPRGDVFDHAVDCTNLPSLFRGYGPIPAIEEATLPEGASLAVGVIRTIRNSDGSSVDEEVLALERPTLHQYRLVSGIKAPFKWLVRFGEGEWTFTESGGKTRVVWRYMFELTSPAAYPPAALLIKTFFRAAMQRCLGRLASQLSALSAKKPG